MNCQKDQKWVVTLSAFLLLPLSGLPQPCCKIPRLKQGMHQKSLFVQESNGDGPVTILVVGFVACTPAGSKKKKKKLEEITGFVCLKKSKVLGNGMLPFSPNMFTSR